MHWTSGTTGDPKCVPRSHNQWHGTGRGCTDGGMLQPGERILAPMQMVHTAGYSGMLMPWLETQGMLAMHQPFDMGVFLDQIEQCASTTPSTAPAMLNALLKSEHARRPRRQLGPQLPVRLGAARSVDDQGFKERYGIEIVNAFGSTEGMTFMCGPTMTADPHRRARYFPRLRGARPTPAARTGAADRAGRRDPPARPRNRRRDRCARQPGELVFRSPALFPGYWTAEHELDRRDFDAEGYFRSGEMFEIAGEGEDARFYHYIDRLKDVINRGGLKIPVGELEAAIQEHPASPKRWRSAIRTRSSASASAPSSRCARARR